METHGKVSIVPGTDYYGSALESHASLQAICSWFENYPRLTWGVHGDSCNLQTNAGRFNEISNSCFLPLTYNSPFMVQSTSHSTRNNICNWSSEVNCNLKRFPVFRQGMRTHVSVRFLSKILFVMENDL